MLNVQSNNNYGTSAALGAQLNNAPKEIGLLMRADGIRSGLSSLRSRLEDFQDRINGSGSSNVKGEAPMVSGLNGAFSDAENELRLCLSIMDGLNNKF